MLITLADDPLIKLPTPEVTITPDRSTETVEFEIVDNLDGGMSDRTVTLMISYSEPSQFMDSVLIGGSSTFKSMKIVITEDDCKFIS